MSDRTWMPKLELTAECTEKGWIVTSRNVPGLIVNGETFDEALSHVRHVAGLLAYANGGDGWLAKALLYGDEFKEARKLREDHVENRRQILQDLMSHGDHLIGELRAAQERNREKGEPIPEHLADRAATLLALMRLPEMYNKLEKMGVWSNPVRGI